jgi:hypothetical protein
MGLQRYRAEAPGKQEFPNGAVPWYAYWMGGHTLSLVRNCPTVFGRRTVYALGEPDTYFSIPAACTFKGRTVEGYLTVGDEGWEFRAYNDCYWFPHVKREP